MERFAVAGEELDSLDLKVLVLTRGISVADGVYEELARSFRISRDPLRCSVFFLPDGTVIHLADVGPAAPFRLAIGSGGVPCLLHDGDFVTELSLPPRTAFYDQTTTRGVPFRGMAVLQGRDVLSFPYLWPCEIAKAGLACKFCHCGNFTQQQVAEGTHRDFIVAPQDVAEVVDWAVNVEKCVKYIQITGGTTLNTNGECGRIIEMLQAIDETAGFENIQGELLLYMTPPSDPAELDGLFAAGADRIACDIEIWDETLAKRICPGKATLTGRQRHLDALSHVAATQGRNKACSAFVVGLEPAESFLVGAEYLASRGVVPIPSIWMPHGLPVPPGLAPPELPFYRKVKAGLAGVYSKYGCEPPGDAGFNVCLCRDTWNHRSELVSIC